MRRYWLCMVLLIAAGHASAASLDTKVEAHGVADRNVPAWTITAHAPAGWTPDCCTYARAIGVDYVLYQGAWTGKPERVIVLNVWPSKLPSLDAEVQDDRKHYLQRDPGAKVDALTVNNHWVSCRGVSYAGTDHIDDVVVFCDPGKASGIRYSWSMTLDHADPARKAMLDAFRQVVEHSRYRAGEAH